MCWAPHCIIHIFYCTLFPEPCGCRNSILLGTAFRSWNTAEVQWHLLSSSPFITFLHQNIQHICNICSVPWFQLLLLDSVQLVLATISKTLNAAEHLYCHETTWMAELRTLTAVWEILGDFAPRKVWDSFDIYKALKGRTRACTPFSCFLLGHRRRCFYLWRCISPQIKTKCWVQARLNVK